MLFPSSLPLELRETAEADVSRQIAGPERIWQKVTLKLGAGALSQLPHDEFLALCALSTSGELTQEERNRL
jgi:hypothetical protein